MNCAHKDIGIDGRCKACGADWLRLIEGLKQRLLKPRVVDAVCGPVKVDANGSPCDD